MKIEYKNLLAELSTFTTRHKDRVLEFQQLSEHNLQFRESENRWSILENIEHLNRYAEFYLPVMEQACQKAQPSKDSTFTSGILGNYFALSMLPGSDMKTMDTFKSKNPLGENLDRFVLDTFISYLVRLEDVIEHAKGKNLSIRTKITIPFLKIKLGDTLRVVVYHHERHMSQIDKILRYQKANPTSNIK